MQDVHISLDQCWGTLDEAIDYFLDVVLDLKALKRQPELPTDIYIDVETNDDTLNEQITNAEPRIMLKS